MERGGVQAAAERRWRCCRGSFFFLFIIHYHVARPLAWGNLFRGGFFFAAGAECIVLSGGGRGLLWSQRRVWRAGHRSLSGHLVSRM